MTERDTKHPSYKATMLVYVLLAGSILMPAALVAAFLGLRGTREEIQGSGWERHAVWQQISTLGGTILWALGGSLYYYQGLTPALWVALVGVPWLLYRVVHGGLRFYGQMPILKPWRII
jgi:uncharacterized membrane protein